MTVAAAVSSPKSRVLIVGATGFIGQFVTEASVESGRPTYVLVRSVTTSTAGSPSKSKVIKELQDKGATILYGSISDKELMEKILREHEIDIVISAIGGAKLLDQLPLVEAIKAVGTVKRFLPSEFGHDVVRADPVEPGLMMYNEKRRVRRLIEELGVPYTYICCNSIASWPYYDNHHPSQVLPPLDHFQIYGDGTVKVREKLAWDDPSGTVSCKFFSTAYFVAGSDIGKFTMRTVDDRRAENKSVHFRPSCNYYNINELASLWENKIGRTLPRIIVTENQLLAAAAENRIPQSIVASFTHDIFIRGCQINFTIDGPHDIEVTDLYPDEPFRSLDDCFNDFALKLNHNSTLADPITSSLFNAATCA